MITQTVYFNDYPLMQKLFLILVNRELEAMTLDKAEKYALHYIACMYSDRSKTSINESRWISDRIEMIARIEAD